jgi:membrane protease YdiL (CAAX protease family)
LIVLALSLGASGVYALFSLLDSLTSVTPLADQTASLNTSDSPKPWLDLLYQLAGITFALAPAALAVHLLRGAARIGLTPARPGPDLGWGTALAVGIGLPGVAFYLLGRALGITLHVSTQSLGAHWWTVPVLIAAAAKNGLLEEVVGVGYLGERLTELGWRPAAWIAASAALRGSYHLYQGFGPFCGNVAMGVVFAWFYHRRGRVMPLVVAHTLIDVVAFLGPSLVPTPWLT